MVKTVTATLFCILVKTASMILDQPGTRFLNANARRPARQNTLVGYPSHCRADFRINAPRNTRIMTTVPYPDTFTFILEAAASIFFHYDGDTAIVQWPPNTVGR